MVEFFGMEFVLGFVSKQISKCLTYLEACQKVEYRDDIEEIIELLDKAHTKIYELIKNRVSYGVLIDRTVIRQESLSRNNDS